MKKVLLTSAAALALFAAAIPAFAEGNGINGGANTPGPYDSREAYENQSEFVSARTVEEYLNAHASVIEAQANEVSGLPAAKAALAAFNDSKEAFEMNSQARLAKIAELEAAVADATAKYQEAYNNARNEAVQRLQNVQNTGKKAEGNFYILNETPEQKNARYIAEHGGEGEMKDSSSTTPSEEQTAKAKAEAEKSKKAEEKTKVAAKTPAKELPKTHAVK